MKCTKACLALKAIALMGLAAAVLCAGPASAENIYVNASALTSGDGSAAHPFWRITNAVARARRDRKNDDERIVIHVAPGVYMGSYNASDNPRQERLPIVLNVPKLTLKGATVLDLDDRGLPTGAMSGKPQTMLATTDSWNFDGHGLLIICRTQDGGAGDDVTVRGLTLNNLSSQQGGAAIWVEHVSAFTIRENVIRHFSLSVATRLSSGAIKRNLLTDTFTGGGPPVYVDGGSATYPAKVTIQGNRITHGEQGIAAGPNIDPLPLNFGDTGLAGQPLYMTGNGVDVSVGLDVAIIGNDISDNVWNGIDFGFYGPDAFQEEVQSAGSTLLRAIVSGNAINRNGAYGLTVEAGDPFGTNPDYGFSGHFIGKFEDNLFVGNGRKQALFTFTSQWTFVFAGGANGFWYLRNALFEVTDLDGELVSFDCDHPILGPVDGTPLRNEFVFNGLKVPPATKITP